jgi:cellulose synthase/poly-beta-1,6-N-acetylglucosamine synthase-like glycosyltransferase
LLLLKIAIIMATGYLLTVSGWLLLLTAASWLYRPTLERNACPLRLLVIIPAHNEEQQIKATINNIRKCDYPQELVDISVIADNCTDATAVTAANCGAQVHVRTDENLRGKGAALDWFLRVNREHLERYGGIVFIDADSCPERNMLLAFSQSLSHPEVDAVQGFNGVANPYENWRTALNSAAFNVFNHLRMAGNDRLFGSTVLKGLGMAFSPRLLANSGWPANSEVEDVEFTIKLIENGRKVRYNSEAIITSEMAVCREQADGQRRRWEGGRFSLARKMIPKLIKGIFLGKGKYLYMVADLLIAPLSILVLLNLLVLLATGIMMPAAAFLPVSAFSVIAAYVISGQVQRKAPVKLWLYLFAFPLFLIWKIAVYFSMLVLPRKRVWSRTLRKSELN